MNPLTGEPLLNLWGYQPTAFCAPNAAYSTNPAKGAQIHEFKQMVRAMHQAGIEVILDMVFNHTAEGDEHGPRGLSAESTTRPTTFLSLAPASMSITAAVETP